VVDDDGRKRIASMCERRIEEDLPEILEATRILVERRWTFEECLDDYRRRYMAFYSTDPWPYGLGALAGSTA
jgi:hypothetical protein